MLQIQPKPQVADVVVIGSGAGGGTVVVGVNVTLLEAGGKRAGTILGAPDTSVCATELRNSDLNAPQA